MVNIMTLEGDPWPVVPEATGTPTVLIALASGDLNTV